MNKYKNIWTAEERLEHDALVDEAWAAGKSTGERGQAYLEGLRDASQAHRTWADDVLLDAITRGATAILKADYKRAHQVSVAMEGHSVEKTRVIGVRRRSSSGAQVFEQVAFDFIAVSDLTTKRESYLSNALAYRDNITLIDKLLALCSEGHADVPSIAADNLRTTVDAWLAA